MKWRSQFMEVSKLREIMPHNATKKSVAMIVCCHGKGQQQLIKLVIIASERNTPMLVLAAYLR